MGPDSLRGRPNDQSPQSFVRPRGTSRGASLPAQAGQSEVPLCRPLQVRDRKATVSRMNDLYEVLQVHRHADLEVIRAAYRTLARKHHPDFGGDPARMVAINEAWSILRDEDRRAAYDAEPQAAEQTGNYAPPSTVSPSDPHGLHSRRPEDRRGSGSVLDFGRYSGWTVGALVDHDPNYLGWLARTPIGRRLAPEINAALERRAAETAALQPKPATNRRRGCLGGLTGTRASARSRDIGAR